MVYGLPVTWEADIKTKIMNEVFDLTKKSGIKLPESKLANIR
jgi:hypothetical protein